MIKDLVCGMEIKQESAKEKIDHEGGAYYFCSTVCKTQFEKNPDNYLKKETFVSRFIDWLGKENEGKKLSCHKK